MRTFVALALLVACKQVGGDDYPIGPGGTGPGGTGGPHDAAGTFGDGGPVINGRACVLMDTRVLDSCQPSGAGNLIVTLAGAMATTATDGSFTIADTSDTNALWQVNDTVQEADVITSVMAKDSLTTIPVIASQTFHDMQNASGVVPSAGAGDIVMRIDEAGVPFAGATVTVMPPQLGSVPLYDGDTDIDWLDIKTGAHGVVWLPNMPTGEATVTISSTSAAGSASSTVVPGITVVAGAIVFVTATVP